MLGVDAGRAVRRRLADDRLLPQRLAIWALIFAAAAILLYARYDWSLSGGFFAKRGFLLSLYLLVLLLPTVYYLLLRTLHSRPWALGLSAATFVLFTLPYKLLGLDSIYYYATHPLYYLYTDFPGPQPAFLPGGPLSTFKYAWLFVPLLFLVGVACVWLVCSIRGRGGFRVGRAAPLLLTAAFAVICAQTFLHSGIRSVYSYDLHYAHPEADHYWHLVYHFANGTGASAGDQPFYSAIEDYFQGAPRSGVNELIRRPFAFYVASQFSYFFNTFYAWLALNCLFWLGAVFATARLVTRLTNERVGVIAGALTVFGYGFIAFVAQPSMYMQNYASVAIALCAFEDLVARPMDGRRRQYGLFVGILAICGLIYDLEPLWVVLIAYGLTRRVPWRPLLGSLVAALTIVQAFPLTVTHILGIPISQLNSDQIGQSLKAVVRLIFHPQVSTWYDTSITVVMTFVQMLLHAYFVIPVILALFGWRFLRDRPQKVLVGTLFAMCFLEMALLFIGRTYVATTPRILYPEFVGIYLPAALAIDRLATWLGGVLAPHKVAGVVFGSKTVSEVAARAAPWAVVAVMALLVNVDAFGQITLSEGFATDSPPVFLPN